MNNSISPLDRNIVKHLKDPEYAEAFFEELVKAPVQLQLAMFRRFRGVTQEKMATKLKVEQGYISKLEKPGSNHLLSNYEHAARTLRGHLVFVPDESKIVPS